jgi:outer membrane protein assembly factor BamB
MVALDKRTGRPLWTTEPLGQDKATYSSPLLFRHAGRRLLANCSSSHGFGVDADTGKLLWSVEVQNRHEVNVATPVYSDGCVFYVTATGTAGALYRLRADGQGIRAEPAWQTPLDTCTGGVILADGILYGSGYSRFKHWLSLDWPSGKILHELKDMTSGSAVYADGRLYCLAEDGRVAMLKPTGGGLEIVSEFLLLGKRARETWAHPVLLDGRLYLRHHDALWCYDVRKP